ncbi:MAG: hypothetical protein WCO06_00685 [Candidatus Roizmanbacteria bacterium]
MSFHYPSKISFNIKKNYYKNSHLRNIFFIIFFLVLIVCGICYLTYEKFVLTPKRELYKTAETSSHYIPKILSHLSEVSVTLTTIYTRIRGVSFEDQDKTLLMQNITPSSTFSGQVAGVSTNIAPLSLPINEFSNNLQTLTTTLKTSKIAEKHSVLGISTNENQTTSLQKMKDTANLGITTHQKAIDTIADCSLYIHDINMKNPPLMSILKNIENTNKESLIFLNETGNTFEYYSQMATIQIQMSSLLSTYITLLQQIAEMPNPTLYEEKLGTTLITMKDIQNNIKKIEINELPEEILDLHNDNIKTADILVSNMSEIEKTVKVSDYKGYLKGIIKLQQDLEPITIRSLSTELSFWNNNKIIKGRSILAEQYKKENELLKEVMSNLK